MHDLTPKIFIHYSWDSEEHKHWVIKLSNRLISDGINICVDVFDLKLGSNLTFYMERIESCDKVIMIMTESYKLKVDKRSGGVGYEYQIISSILSRIIAQNEKIIPVLKSGTNETSIPILLQAHIYLDMRYDSNFESKYIELLRVIYDEPELKKPMLGVKPNFSNLKNKLTEDNSSILSFFDKTHEELHEILGQPQYSDLFIETYWSHGLEFFYNKHTRLVDGIQASRLVTGVVYNNEILEIKIGDSFAQIKSKFGNPLN